MGANIQYQRMPKFSPNLKLHKLILPRTRTSPGLFTGQFAIFATFPVCHEVVCTSEMVFPNYSSCTTYCTPLTSRKSYEKSTKVFCTLSLFSFHYHNVCNMLNSIVWKFSSVEFFKLQRPRWVETVVQLGRH